MSGVWPKLSRSMIFREPQWIKTVLSEIEYNTQDIKLGTVNFVLHK
jgi:hypothetical protein